MNRSEWQFYKRQRNALFQPLRHLPKEAGDGDGGGTTARRGKSVGGNLDGRWPSLMRHSRTIHTCRYRLILYCVALHCIEAAGSDQISKTRKGRVAV